MRESVWLRGDTVGLPKRVNERGVTSRVIVGHQKEIIKVHKVTATRLTIQRTNMCMNERERGRAKERLKIQNKSWGLKPEG
jgi:Trm5-related predicted tRNA methylase